MAAMVGAASAAPAVIQQRAMGSIEVVYAIKNITLLSSNLKDTTQKIDFSPLAIVTPDTFTPVIKGFYGIIDLVNKDIQTMKDNPMAPLAQDGQTAICTAFREFVVVHQNLLAIVIGKSGLVVSFGGGPVAAVLRILEGAVDTIAFGIIDAVPFCAAGAQMDKDSLTKKIHQAQCAYFPLGTVKIGLTEVTCSVFLGLTPA